MTDLSNIVKAYDVRGTVPDQLDADDRPGRSARRSPASPGHPGSWSSPATCASPGCELAAAFAEGVTGQGVDVVDAGLGSTDLLYYAAGTLDVPGAMFTASHNPAQYNGIKMCLAGAAADRPGHRPARDPH